MDLLKKLLAAPGPSGLEKEATEVWKTYVKKFSPSVSTDHYGNTKVDAKSIGFDDSFIYDEIEKSFPDRQIKANQLLPEEAIEAFKAWHEKEDKLKY